ncbi:MAG: EamA family transporter [Candidatus Kaiserbacteria bacterium]|nr:EamA family transporter [Candidatus Kaiserbacteria bacterium]
MIWFLLIGIGLALGDVFMNHWADNGSRFSGQLFFVYLLALVIYCASLTLYAYQLKTTQLSIATVIPLLINVALVFTVSTFFLHEKINTYQLIGISLALVAIVFLSRQ